VALTNRGKTVVGVVLVLLVLGGAAGAYVFLNNQGDDPTDNPTPQDTDGDGTPDTTSSAPENVACPLTGVIPPEGAPADHPALAIKIEESPDARPQVGLAEADIVYEQPVEGNITRLIAVYHCRDASRIGPVRSARFMDANLLPQFGTPLFGYAGGAPETKARIAAANLVDLSYITPEAVASYERDVNREAPHNLYTSSASLWAVGEQLGQGGRPEAVFVYSDKPGKGKKSTMIDLPFNTSLAHISWQWKPASKTWVRFVDGEPALLEDGTQISTQNVIVQEITQIPTDIKDAHGSTSYEVEVLGQGKAYLFRNGRMIVGTWRKDSPESPTVFTMKNGSEMALAPGTTWVELYGNQTNTLSFVPSLAQAPA
jgi:hypothetical protein